MDWKDIGIEVLIKLKLKKAEKVNRRVRFFKHEINEMVTTSTIIKGRLITEIENRLSRRSITGSYLFTDNRIFEPYTDLLLVNLSSREFYSYTYEIGAELIRIVTRFETDKGVNVNKADLYFGMALSSIYKDSTISASVFWEMSQEQESFTLGAAYAPVTSIQNAISRFTSSISPIEHGLKENFLYNYLYNNYNWLGDFKTNLVKLHNPHTFSYLSTGLRNRAIGYWMSNHFTDMTKMYGQELLNALCILGESLLKLKPGVTQGTFGKIINHDLPTLNAGVSAIIGTGVGNVATHTGFWVTYKTYLKIDFDTNFPLLINHIKTNALTDDELKAYIIWGLYMLRNKALHDYDPTLCYYTNKTLFADAIGLALASVPIVAQL